MIATALPVFVEVLATALAVLFLQMGLKNRRPLDQNSRSFDDLRAEYYTVYTTQMLAYAMISMPFIPFWYFGLRWVSKCRGSSLGAARFVVLPSDIFWMATAFFAGLFSAILLVNHHIKPGWSLFDEVHDYDRVRGCRCEKNHRAEWGDSGISALRDTVRRWHELEHRQRLLDLGFGSGQANHGIRGHESASAAPGG